MTPQLDQQFPIPECITLETVLDELERNWPVGGDWDHDERDEPRHEAIRKWIKGQLHEG